jgi:hypothetical protein
MMETELDSETLAFDSALTRLIARENFITKVNELETNSKRHEVTGGWRKLHNEKLHSLYSSPNIIRVTKSRRMRWAGHVACMGMMRNVYRILFGKPVGKRPPERPRHRWVDNIKKDLEEIGFGGMDWILLAQDRDWWWAVVNMGINM